MLKFTPLEFETFGFDTIITPVGVKIYSVGVWNGSMSPVTAPSAPVKIYSVGVWNDEQISETKKFLG